MKYPVYSQSGEKVGEALLPKDIFEVPLKQDLLWQVVRSQMANQRQATVETNTRRQVRGGGKKPRRQKGTGRARHASIRSPLWRGGGTVFGPIKEKSYKQKINKKMRKAALLVALSAKAKDKDLVLLDDLKINQAKTKEIAKIIAVLREKVDNFKKGKTLFILPAPDEKIVRASRNLVDFATIEARNISPLVLLSFKNLLLTKETISQIKKIFSEKDKTV